MPQAHRTFQSFNLSLKVVFLFQTFRLYNTICASYFKDGQELGFPAKKENRFAKKNLANILHFSAFRSLAKDAKFREMRKFCEKNNAKIS